MVWLYLTVSKVLVPADGGDDLCDLGDGNLQAEVLQLAVGLPQRGVQSGRHQPAGVTAGVPGLDRGGGSEQTEKFQSCNCNTIKKTFVTNSLPDVVLLPWPEQQLHQLEPSQDGDAAEQGGPPRTHLTLHACTVARLSVTQSVHLASRHSPGLPRRAGCSLIPPHRNPTSQINFEKLQTNQKIVKTAPSAKY